MTKVSNLKQLATTKTYLVTYQTGRTQLIESVLSMKALAASLLCVDFITLVA